MGVFSNDDEKDPDNWLDDHKKEFGESEKFVPPGTDWKPAERGNAWRTPKKKPKKAPKPIEVGKYLRTCRHCGGSSPVELFRDSKCLGCQAADFLGPL